MSPFNTNHQKSLEPNPSHDLARMSACTLYTDIPTFIWIPAPHFIFLLSSLTTVSIYRQHEVVFQKVKLSVNISITSR